MCTSSVSYIYVHIYSCRITRSAVMHTRRQNIMKNDAACIYDTYAAAMLML